MNKNKENSNDKLKKWLDFDFKLDTKHMRDLNSQEEEACSKALNKISEQTNLKLFED